MAKSKAKTETEKLKEKLVESENKAETVETVDNNADEQDTTDETEEVETEEESEEEVDLNDNSAEYDPAAIAAREQEIQRIKEKEATAKAKKLAKAREDEEKNPMKMCKGLFCNYPNDEDHFERGEDGVLSDYSKDYFKQKANPVPGEVKQAAPVHQASRDRVVGLPKDNVLNK